MSRKEAVRHLSFPSEIIIELLTIIFCNNIFQIHGFFWRELQLVVVFKSPVWSGFSAKFSAQPQPGGCLLFRFTGNRQPDRKKTV